MLDKIAQLRGQIKTLLNGCSHPVETVDIKYMSDSWNYDPSNNRYWTEYTCSVCGKRWEEE